MADNEASSIKKGSSKLPLSKPPKIPGIRAFTRDQWSELMLSMQAYYVMTGRFPVGPTDYAAIRKLVTSNPSDRELAMTMQTIEFASSLQLMGLPLPENFEDAKKIEALDVLSRAKGPSIAVRLRRLGVSEAIYQNWLRDPVFRRELNERSEVNFEALQHEVNGAVQRQAVGGKMEAIKYFNDLSGRNALIEAGNKGPSVQDVVMSVVDIITRHVKDPAVLGAVAGELRGLLSGAELAAPAEKPEPKKELSIRDYFK